MRLVICCPRRSSRLFLLLTSPSVSYPLHHQVTFASYCTLSRPDRSCLSRSSRSPPRSFQFSFPHVLVDSYHMALHTVFPVFDSLPLLSFLLTHSFQPFHPLDPTCCVHLFTIGRRVSVFTRLLHSTLFGLCLQLYSPPQIRHLTPSGHSSPYPLLPFSLSLPAVLLPRHLLSLSIAPSIFVPLSAPRTLDPVLMLPPSVCASIHFLVVPHNLHFLRLHFLLSSSLAALPILLIILSPSN